MKKRKINKNLLFLINSFNDGNRGVVLEGSSRSGKTFSSIDFIIRQCSITSEPLVFNIVKETYNSFKTTLYDDFSKRLNKFGLDNPFERSQEVASFKIFNHKVNLLGADKPSKFHGASCDYLWFNEGLDIQRSIFDQAEQRCRLFWWSDYNPYVSLHYVYDNIIPRDDVAFLKTTYKDNPFISDGELNKILSYDPNNQENIRQGTADDYMHAVYALGERMSRQGLIYRDVTWVDEFPSQDLYDRVGYAMDLGFTNSPTTLCKSVAIGGNLFSECLIYEPTETPEDLAAMLKMLGLSDTFIWCDSAHPLFIGKLNELGCKVYAIKKTPIMDGIGLVKSWNLHFVKNRNVQKEQENYSMREINGIVLDEPVKKHDHFFDALRYNVLANFRRV